MSLQVKSKLRKNFGISTVELLNIKNFMQGVVYCWGKNREHEYFSLRDLVGGTNFNWTGTPLQCLYQKHIAEGKLESDATSEAGKDLGGILKVVLHEDKRLYGATKKGMVAHYKWIA